jgi:hypothetical protein
MQKVLSSNFELIGLAGDILNYLRKIIKGFDA